MPYFVMRIFHTWQCNNSKDSLQRSATHWQLTHTWNPGGCIIDSSLITTGKTFIIKESKLKIPDSWGATGLRQWGCSERAQRCFLSNYCTEQPGETCSLWEQGHVCPQPLALCALTNKWQQHQQLQTVCRTPITRAYWVNAFQVRFNILPCPQGFQKSPSVATSAQCAWVTLSAVSVLYKLYLYSEFI